MALHKTHYLTSPSPINLNNPTDTHPINYSCFPLSFLFAFSLYLPCVCHSVCALILWGNSCSPRFSIFLTTPPLSIIDRAVRRSTEANPSYKTRQRILCYKDPVLKSRSIDVFCSPWIKFLLSMKAHTAASSVSNEDPSYIGVLR